MARFVYTLLLSVGFFVGPLVSFGQGPEVKKVKLTLAECLETALKTNSLVVQGGYDLDMAGTEVARAKGAFLPSVSTNYTFNRSLIGPREGAQLDETTGRLITTVGNSRTSGSQNVGASFNVPILDLSKFADLSSSKNGKMAAEMNLSRSRQQVVFQTKEAYFGLLKAIKLLEVQQEQIQVSEETHRRSETLYEIGSAHIAQVYSAKSQLQRDRSNLISRENDVEVARSNLGFRLGLGTDVRVVLADEQFEVEPPKVTYEEALNRAMERHPSLLSQEYFMMRDRDNLRATQFRLRHPTVSMNAGYNWTLAKDEDFGGLGDLFDRNYNYSFNMRVSLPVFDRLSTEYQVKSRKLQLLRSEEMLEQARRETALDIQQTFLSLERLRLLTEANQAAVQAAEEDFKLQDERYKLGAGTFLERQTAQVTLFEARSELVQAIYDYQTALARLDQAMGGRGEEEGG